MFLLILRLKARSKLSRRREPAVYSRRIDGAQVNAFLHPQISENCLLDHGLQFGKGFRRKEGPPLPHDGSCRCRIQPFSFTSTEVFNGALRSHAPLESSIGGLDQRDGQRLLDALKQIIGQPPPAQADDYVARVMAFLNNLDAPVKAAVEAFLRERHAYLRGAGGAQASRIAGSAAKPPAGPASDESEVVKS
ncbi:MAG: hypothetical protein HY342_00810 [Candidatus Lambdaproteobacteria bacterium]|nr:hypothetical protein [Candidatus Lambdaproteobacteria bacterium]